jgi:dethiobiotin synthetase
VVFTGTGTEVGKTWWAAAVARELRGRGLSVAARKPAQSFARDEGATDADVLAGATGALPEEVCPRPRWYELPMAPPMAADALGRPAFTIADLVAELRWPPRTDLGIVEGAGGPRSPLAHDGDTVDLAAALSPDALVLVASAGLGTVNAVSLAAAALRGIAPLTVAMNRFDAGNDLHRRNREWLEERAGLDVVDSVESLLLRIA